MAIEKAKKEKVRIGVKGYIEMSKENLDMVLSHSDPHTGIVYSLHMGYVDTNNIEFDIP